MSTEPNIPTGYLLTDDLMWMSRVMGEAKEVGCKIIPARTLEQLVKLLSEQGPRCVLLDLAHQAIEQDPAPLIQQIQAAGATRIVAYGSHLETAHLNAARQAGCDPVLARSLMVKKLSEMLPIWLQG